MPVTEKKPSQFAFIMSDEDKRMLKRLAAVSDRSGALILRELLRAEYHRRFPETAL